MPLSVRRKSRQGRPNFFFVNNSLSFDHSSSFSSYAIFFTRSIFYHILSTHPRFLNGGIFYSQNNSGVEFIEKIPIQIEEMIKTLKQSIPVIMVSHSLQQASRLADYAVVVDDGNILRTFNAQEFTESVNDGSLIKLAF